MQLTFKLCSFDIGSSCIDRQRAGTRRNTGEGATVDGELDVLVLVEKNSSVEAYMPVEKVALEPRFVCRELLGVEGHGLLRKKGPRIDATTLEPRRCLGVGHEPCSPAVLD